MHETFGARVTRCALVAIIAAGCAGSPPAAPSIDPGGKAGEKAAPIAITVADSQWGGRPSNLPLDEFERQVESDSAGAMTVDIVTNASMDADPPNSDVPIMEKVRSGEFEMAVVPARAWSTAGDHEPEGAPGAVPVPFGCARGGGGRGPVHHP